MKEIICSNGKIVQVSDEDYEYFSQFNWCMSHNYAYRYLKRKPIYMHHEVAKRIGLSIGIKNLDHKDLNRSNNQRTNIRLATSSQNGMNRKINKNNTSNEKGIDWRKDCRKWRVRLSIEKKQRTIGYYNTLEEAIKIRNEAYLKYHGEFARIK